MIEFQLTVYMCSYCTRVHNAATDCHKHELEEHFVKGATPTKSPPNPVSVPEPAVRSAVADDVKPAVVGVEGGADEKREDFDSYLRRVHGNDMDEGSTDLSNTAANTDIIIAGPHIEDNASLERRMANNIQPSTYQKSFPPIQPSAALQNYRQQVNSASSSNSLFKTEHITKINAKYLPKACEPCKMTFDTLGSYNRHLMASKAHRKERDEKRLLMAGKFKFNCDPCEYHTNQKPKYIRHLGSNVHRGLRKPRL